MGRAAALTFIGCALFGAASCSGSERQLLVIVDTDVALPAHVGSDPAIAPGAIIERLRVDMLPNTGLENPIVSDPYSRIFELGPTTKWPLSFAVSDSGTPDGLVRIRIRGYRADSTSRTDNLLTSSDASRPLLHLTIDRFVIVELPQDDVVKKVRVVLSGDCLGAPANIDEQTNCITNPDAYESARGGFTSEDAPSIAGTWSSLRSVPCALPAPPDKDVVCEPGGVTIRGDLNFEDVDTSFEQVESTPRHFVRLAPFYIDRREVTVGRFRKFVATGALSAEQVPDVRSPTNPNCTWSDTAGADEELPINCIPYRTARAFCKAEGGDLPTDAQWEHAARGARVGASYVWGDEDARCCSARTANVSGCPGIGPAVVGSYADPARCEGRADVTPEGVVDLAGNVREMVVDAPESYDSEKCPRAAIAKDPVCDPDGDAHTARGGSFRTSFDRAKIGMRTTTRISDDVGFRCVYPGAP